MGGSRGCLRTWRMAVRVVPVVLGIAAGCRSSGHEGTVQGEKALFEFFEGKLPEGR